MEDEPWCLCDRWWYQVFFKKNPLVLNHYWYAGWFDPEEWLEWWHFAAPVRIYYTPNRRRWINFPLLSWRHDQIWGEEEEVL